MRAMTRIVPSSPPPITMLISTFPVAGAIRSEADQGVGSLAYPGVSYMEAQRAVSGPDKGLIQLNST